MNRLTLKIAEKILLTFKNLIFFIGQYILNKFSILTMNVRESKLKN